MNFAYNADGQRTQKTFTEYGTTVTTTEYLYNGDKLAGQQFSNGKTLTFLYDHNGEYIGLDYNGTEYYYIKNLQGDVIAIADATGTIVGTYTYSAWGEVYYMTGLSSSQINEFTDNIVAINPIRYRGYYYDAETGLYHLNSRYYDPATGRFVNADGFVSTGQGILGNNMFAYCNNDPVNNCDPTGTFAIAATAAGTAAGLLFELAKLAAGVIASAVIIQQVHDTTEKITAANPPVNQGQSTYSPELPYVGPLYGNSAIRNDIQSRVRDNAPSLSDSLVKTRVTENTPIYRYYSSKTENLAPRPGKDYDGLSFSTKPPRPGVSAVVTTIEGVNATGVLLAMPTGGSHVTVIPTNGSVSQWMAQGQSSIWSQTLSAIVIEWNGMR